MRIDLISRLASLMLVFVFMSNDLIASGIALSQGLAIENSIPENAPLHFPIGTEVKAPLPNLQKNQPLNSEISQGHSKSLIIRVKAREQAIQISSSRNPIPQDPAKEILSFQLPELTSDKVYAKLSYRIKATDGEGEVLMAKSLNAQRVFGLNRMNLTNRWTDVEEYLPLSDLNQGLNFLRWDLPSREFGVEVTDAKILLYGSKEPNSINVRPEFLERLVTEDQSLVKALPLESNQRAFKLRAVELPSMPAEMINITQGALAYQPSNEMAREAESIGIKLKLKSLPSGFTLKDIQIHYFDYQYKSWMIAPIDSIDNNGEIAFVPNKGSTQYFGALIKSPEMPESNAFAPTMMSDLEAANPAAGISLISPPSISRTGEASISYPMEIPAGRAGMQPSLSVNYSSEGGSGIAGVGWNIPLQMIGVDTRWGVPSFDATNQSEVYTHNGESLIEEGGHKANRSVTLRQNGPVQFFSKNRGSYQELVRVNDSPDRYLWILTDANQTKYYYGTSDGTTLASDAVLQDANGNILRWYLKRVEDVWGNYTEYYYSKTGPHNVLNGFSYMEANAYTIVLDHILYTGHTNGQSPKYKVQFSYTDHRLDASLNLKEGLKILDHNLLDKVEVLFNDGNGFSSFKDWRFHYENGAFSLYKNRLTKIEEYRNGQFFYDHDFYYNDAKIGFGDSYKDIDFVEPRSAVLDEMGDQLTSRRGPVLKEINGAPIRSSSSEGGKFNLALGGGWDPDPVKKSDKNATFSGTFNGSFTDTKGNTVLQDLNGDGLPDFRLRTADGDFYYPLEKGTNENYTFGPPLKMNTDVYEESYQHSFDYGLDFIASWDFYFLKFALGAGINYNTSWSTTSRYMLDYNNDGIQDLVYENGDRSFLNFGYYDNYRRLRFTPNSNNTLNPVVTGATPPTNPSQEWPLELELVRSWIAPFTGNIAVSGTASIEDSVNGSMKVAVQLNDAFLDPINKFLDVTPGSSVNVAHTVSVQAGDTLFFRTRSGDNGFEDLMIWNPQVTYTSMGPAVDPNGVNYSTSTPLGSFLLSGAQGITLAGNDSIKILGGSQSFTLSDDLLVRMVAQVTDATTNTHTSYHFDKVLDAGTSSIFSTSQLELQSDSLPAQNFFVDFASFAQMFPAINDEDQISLYFEVFSTSNVDWQTIDWRPEIQFRLPGCDGVYNDAQNIYPTVDYKTYNRLIEFSGSQSLAFNASNEYRPWLSLSSGFDPNQAFLASELSANYLIQKQAYVTVKAGGSIVQKLMLRVDNSGNHGFYEVDAKGESGQTLVFNSVDGVFTGSAIGANDVHFEVFVDDPTFGNYLATQISAFQIIDVSNSFNLLYSGTDYSMYKAEPTLLFDQISHWGKFGYNQKDETLALNPAHIKLAVEDILNNSNNNFTDPSNSPPGDLEAFSVIAEDLPNLDDIRYLGIMPRRGEYEAKTRQYIRDAVSSTSDLDAWVINSTHCGFYRGNLIAAGKFLEPDRKIQAGGAATPSGTDIAYGRPRKTESKSLAGSFTFSVKAPIYNGYGPDASYAPSRMINGSAFYNNPLSQMIDLNGDGYPDLMEADNGISVYYTNPLGGLVSNTSTNISQAIAGKSVTSTPVSVKVGLGQQINQDKRFLLSEPPSIGATKSLTKNTEYVGWQDFNGDGLQDLFESSDGDDYFVRLNNGYGLNSALLISELNAPVSNSESEGLSSGLEILSSSKDKLSGSFTVGVNIVNSGSISERFYMDLTGDGLPDEILVSPDPVQANKFDWSLNVNTGTGFQGAGVQSLEADFEAANKSRNLGFTGNGNLSLSFKLFGNKANTTGGGTYNFSVNKTLSSFIDVNGDGLVDYVESLGKGHTSKLRVYFNENGLANKLDSVSNPLHGSFSISYQLEGAKNGLLPAQVKIDRDPANAKVMWDMPSAKWVMSQVVIYDGLDIQHPNNGSPVDLDGADEVLIDFVYDGGVFNRREKAFMGFSRLETRSPQTSFQIGPTDFVPRYANHDISESPDVVKYYAEVQVFEPFTKRKFQDYLAHEYKKGVLTDHYYFLAYHLNYEAFETGTSNSLGHFEESDRLLISHKQNTIQYVYVDHSDPGAGLGRIKDNGSGSFALVDWETIDETSVVTPLVTTMETVVRHEMDSVHFFQNLPAPSSYIMQGTRYEIEYDDYFNITRYTLGTSSDVTTPSQVVIGYVDDYYIETQKHEPLVLDFMQNTNLSGFRTSLLSWAPGGHYRYDVIPDDPSYTAEQVSLGDYWDPANDCGAAIGDIYTIPVYLQKEVHDSIPIYKTDYSLSYSGTLIAEMEYYAPGSAENKTGVLKDHKIYEGSTANPPKRHSRVTNLKPGVGVPNKMENVLVGTGQVAATDILYDVYGNVTRVTGPVDANAQRATMDYTYDTDLHQFPVAITNVFGESSCMTYDYKFGNPLLIIDPNNQPMQYQYDDFGRVQYIWAPREYYRGTLPTIEYEYDLSASIPVAVTTHNIEVDTSAISVTAPTCGTLKAFSFTEPPAFASTLKTAVFIDGLGKTVQVKKESSDENSGLFQKAREVSGFSKTNRLGQVFKTSISEVESISNNIKTLHTFNSLTDQSAVYDLLGRTIHTETLGEKVDTDVSYFVTTGTYGEPADMLGIQTETDYIKAIQVLDARGQKVSEIRFRSSSNVEETKFVYNEIGELESYFSPAGVQVDYTYDAFGRVITENHPDRGLTSNTYDLASNLLKTETPATGSAGISFDYQYGRLSDVTFPSSDAINGLKYTYGSIGDGTNGVGRIIKIEQGNGFKQDDYKYDFMGNLIYEKKVINTPLFGDQEYLTKYSYDSWGRILGMIYPDGEEVAYHYNEAGDLESITGHRAHISSYNIVSEILYNGLGQKKKITYGNGTVTDFSYDLALSRRLTGLDLQVKTPGGGSAQLLNKTIEYNNAGGIKEIENHAIAVSAGAGGLIGGKYKLFDINYDGMNQVTSLNQLFGQNTLGTENDIAMNMSYNSAGRLAGKTLSDASAPQLDYSLSYRYGASNNNNTNITSAGNTSSTNHRLEEVSDVNGDLYEYDYDGIGNMRQQVISNNNQIIKTDNYCWHENATLKGWSNGDQSANGMAAHYVYDHSGERVLKTIAYGGLATVNNRGNVVMAMESPTVYVNPYYIATPYQEAQLVSKHYYMGSQRVASSVTDLSPQPWGTPPSGEEYEIPNQSTAADAVIMDFVETMNCVFNDQIQFGFGDMLSIPQLDEIAFVDCEEGTVIEDVEPFLTENLQCACEQGTYWVSQNGFNCNEVNVMYWYHPDYLGSVEAVTDVDGEVYQFFHNTIWGEPLQDQKAFLFNNFTSRFRFNGKERDWETGNYYYGARYYDPKISLWLSIDPLAAKFNNLSPYHYTVNNPLNVIDYDGRDTTFENKDVKSDFDRVFNDLSNTLARTGEKLGKLQEKQANSSNPDGFWGKMRQKRINNLRAKHMTLIEARAVLSTIIVDETEFYYYHDPNLPAYSSGGGTSFNPDMNRVEIRFAEKGLQTFLEESRHGIGFLNREVNHNFSTNRPGYYDWTDELIAKSLSNRTAYYLWGEPLRSFDEMKKVIEGDAYDLNYIIKTWEPQNVK